MARKTTLAPEQLTIPSSELAFVLYGSIVVVDNVRAIFDKQKIAELAVSIANNGLMTPLELAATDDPNTFRLIAGERRYRAIGQLIDQGQLPADYEVLATFSSTLIDVEQSEAERIIVVRQLLENIQREDLHPLEEAKAYRRLLDDLGMSQGDLSVQVGKASSHITKRLALLIMPGEIIALFDDGKITLDVIYDLSRLPEDARAKAIKQIKTYPPCARQEVDAHLRRQKIEAAVEKLRKHADAIGLSLTVERPPQADYTIEGQYPVDSLKDYTVKSTHIGMIVNNAAPTLVVYRKITAAERKKIEAAAAEQEARAERIKAERAADPVTAWKDAKDEIFDKFESDESDLAEAYRAAVIQGIVGLNAKAATNVLVRLLLEQRPQAPWSHAATLCLALGISFVVPEDQAHQYGIEHKTADKAFTQAYAEMDAGQRVTAHLLAKSMKMPSTTLVEANLVTVDAEIPAPKIVTCDDLPPVPAGYHLVLPDENDPYESYIVNGEEWAAIQAERAAADAMHDDEYSDDDEPSDDYDEDTSDVAYEGSEHPE